MKRAIGTASYGIINFLCISKNENMNWVKSLFPLDANRVRLVGPANSLGRVELYQEEWGTVCDDRWTIYEGHVVCRMLGFSRAIRLFTSSTFGGGEGKIWLTKLVCNGTEDSLFDCKNAEKYLGNTGCTHQQDAGVECLKDGKLPHIVILIWHNKFWLTVWRPKPEGGFVVCMGMGDEQFSVIWWHDWGGWVAPLCLLMAACC